MFFKLIKKNLNYRIYIIERKKDKKNNIYDFLKERGKTKF